MPNPSASEDEMANEKIKRHSELGANQIPAYFIKTGIEQFVLRLTLRRLMTYIYMEHPFLMFLDHTQRRSTVGRTPLDE